MQIVSDSKPCVQAYQRLCQGQFSASAQISTFLSTLSSYNISVQHIGQGHGQGQVVTLVLVTKKSRSGLIPGFERSFTSFALSFLSI